MDYKRHSDEIDAVVPGVMTRYAELRNSGCRGIYTSLGRYYNHTIFGRDAGMTAKFVSDFDHEVAWQTISTLAEHQGVGTNARTAQQPGKIHHELRDYTQWQGRWYDRFGLWWAGRAWGMAHHQLLSYYAADTTATYIRLINKHAAHIDKSIMERQVLRQDGTITPLADSVADAADWIAAQIDERGIVLNRRTNRWSLPYQTFADSVTAYAWADGQAADTSRPHGFVEVQAYAIDALQDAVRLLPDHKHVARWRRLASLAHEALFGHYWRGHTMTFAPGLFERDGELQQLDTTMITAGWTLNASFWKYMPDMEHRARIISIVQRLFADDMLTPVGIRTKSVQTPDPLGDMIDYHGSRTVWPMFNFMVIEGLRRHGLYRLARQLEFRLLNGINAVGEFPEFMIVDHDQTLYRPDKSARLARAGQMIPEQNIAFTVVPAMTLAYRHVYKRHTPADSGWRYELEESVLASIPQVDLYSPSEATQQLHPTPLRIKRTAAGLASARHILPVLWRRPQ